MTAQPSTRPAHSCAHSDVATRDATCPKSRAHGRRRAARDRQRRPVMIRPLITAGSLALALGAAVCSGPVTSDQAAVGGPVSAEVVPVAASRPLSPSPSPSLSLSPGAGDTLTCRDRRGRSSTNSGGNSDGVSIDILFDQASRDRSSSDRGGGSLVVGCGSDGQLVVLSCAGSGRDGRDNSDNSDRNSDRRNNDRNSNSDRRNSDRDSDHNTGRSKRSDRANGADWNFGERDSRDLDTRELDTRDLQDLIDLSRRTGLDLDELIDLASDSRDNHSDNPDSHTDRDRGSRGGITVEGPLGRIGVGQDTADLWNLYRGSDRDRSARLVRSASDQNSDRNSDRNQGARSSRAGVCRQVDR